MRPLIDPHKRSTCDCLDLAHAGRLLAGQACALSRQHIKDTTVRSGFDREIAEYVGDIVRQVKEARLSPTQGLKVLEDEQKNLFAQSKVIALKGVGALAGAFQIGAGAGICYGSVGWLCPTFGIPLMLHGANNVYENGRDLVRGQSDTQGPVRRAYHSAARFMGAGSFEGDMAYGAVDVGMSVYGAGRLLVRPEAWRLFRYVHSDYVRAYKTSRISTLATDAISGTLTLSSMHEAAKNGN